MTKANTNVTGIQDPSTFNLDILQAGASNEASAPAVQESGSAKLSDDLAMMKALNQGQQSGGLGQTIGGAAGTGVGAAVGGPTGAAVGGAAGGAVGSIVDYMIDKDASDKAEAKRKEGIKKQIEREKAIANSRAVTESRAQRRGIALSREEEAMTERDVINQSRRDVLKNLMSSINQKAQQDEVLKQKFLKSRRIA